MDPLKPPAVVIGDMDLVRPLGLAGIPVVAAGTTGTETRWSRYTNASIDLPDLWNEPEKTVKVLIDYARRSGHRPVLMYQKDPAVLTISRHRDQLEPYYRFVLPPVDLVEDLVDKQRFLDRADRSGLPIPGTVMVVAGRDDTVDLRFPAVVKPAVRDEWDAKWIPAVGGMSGAAAKAIQVESRAGLKELLDAPGLAGMRLIVQELVVGPESEICSYHSYIDEDGRTRGEFTGRKIRTRPSRFGQSTAVAITDDRQVTEVGREILERLDFTGIAKVDLKRRPDGELALLEINPRFSLWNHPGAAAGVNLPALAYASLLGHDLPTGTGRAGVTWCQVWGDRRAAADHRVDTREWLRFAATASTRRAAHFTDPGAFVGAIWHGYKQRRGNGADDP